METRQLHHICGSFRFRLRRLLVQAGLSRAVLLAVVMLALMLTMDWWAHLSRPTRAGMLLVYLAAIAVTVWWTLIVPLRRHWSDTDVLHYVDSVLPADQAMLLDLYELTQSGDQIQETKTATGKELAAAAIAELNRLTDRIELSGTLRYAVAGQWIRRAGLAAAILVIAALPIPIPWTTDYDSAGQPAAGATQPESPKPAAAPEYKHYTTGHYLGIGATRLFNPFSTIRWPHRTTIHLSDVPKAVPMFESQLIEGRITGEIPDRVTMFLKTSSRRSYEPIPLSVNNGFFSHKFDRVSEPFSFYIQGGDYETDTYNLTMTEKPYIKKFRATYTFPAYAGIPNRVDDSNQLRGLEGTIVDVRLECSMPLKQAVLVPVVKRAPGDESATSQPAAAREVLPFVDSSRKVFERRFVLRDNMSYTIDLIEDHGFRQARDERIDILVERDQPPKVRLISPSVELVQTNRASVACAFEVTDDYGLAKVQFLYMMDEDKPGDLTDRITGPITQRGRRSEGRFTWPLRKIDIPEAGVLTCFVRARDVNPLADRGQTESNHARIRLVKPTDFHVQVIEECKKLLNEARLSWWYQLKAYTAGLEYARKGTGSEADPLWGEMTDSQTSSFRAARNMRTHLQWLIDQYERNQMAREFMAGRVVPVGAYMTDLIDKYHKAVGDGIAGVRPKSAGDAEMTRLLATRQAGLAKFTDDQKMATLLLQRIIDQLYDWNDLQMASVTTTLLAEQQDDVIRRNEELTPRLIGKEIEDLPDAEVDKLKTLGKQQKTVLDTETNLETQLDDMIFRARMLKRKGLEVPLQFAFRSLRDSRINDDLKKAARMIDNNQGADVLNDQKKVVRVLRDVEVGLLEAGKKPDAEPYPTLAETPRDLSFDPEEVAKKIAARRENIATTTQPTETTGTVVIKPPPPPAGTRLALAVQATRELQDNVLSRVRYLSNNNGPAEMPRFPQLKLLMMSDRQELAIKKGLNVAIEVANTPEENGKTGSNEAKAVLATRVEEFDQFAKLLASKNISGRHQQCQADCIATLDDIGQMLNREKAVDDSFEEKKGGLDPFKRPYVLREKNLSDTVQILARLNQAIVVQADVSRKLTRFAGTQPATGLLTDFEKANRARASAAQKTVAELVDAAMAAANAMSTEVAESVGHTGVKGLSSLKLASYVQPIADASIKPEQVTELTDATGTMLQVFQALRDLMNDYVKPKETPGSATQPVVDPLVVVRPPTTQPKDLTINDETLSPELRARMVRSLQQKFPDRYKTLLIEYYRTFVKDEDEIAPK